MKPAFAYASLWFASILVIACKSEVHPAGPHDDYTTSSPTTCVDHDGDGYGVGCALGSDCDDANASITTGCHVCEHPAPGCPCSIEKAKTSCGKVVSQLGNATTCAYGESVCSNGTWSDCFPNGKTVQAAGARLSPLGLAPAAACELPCDPYCQQFPDTPDETLSTPQGIVGTDAGLTLEQVDATVNYVAPNGPIPSGIQAILEDGGMYPDAQPDAIVYHELSPAAAAVENTAVGATVPKKSVDVYFLQSSAGTNPESSQRLADAVTAPNGVIDRVTAAVPDAEFGVGRFGQYDDDPWNKGTGSPTSVYENVLSMSADRMQIGDALQYAFSRYVNASAVPRTWMPTLFAVSTTEGLKSDTDWWVVPRASWTSPVTGVATNCPTGTIGYPCFRPTAVPVTVLLTEVPSGNGPGGQYAFARNNDWNISGARPWSTVTPVAVHGNDTEANAYVINPRTFGIFTGNTETDGLRNNNWPFLGDVQCDDRRGITAPNVYFTFTVTDPTWYHFDVIDSDYAAVVYIYRAGGTYLACNEHADFDSSPQWLPVSLDGVVDPGTYFVVVDGVSGAVGNYVLHVAAMPDGAGVGPIAAPNYDESVSAYNAIGGKIVGVDVSGYTCDNQATPSWLVRNTSNSLEKVLVDTGSVDPTKKPYLRYLDHSANLCHAGDAPFEQQLADAILGVSEGAGLVTARSDVTAVAVDVDDAIDFDGPPGGNNLLTPTNVDDSKFLVSVETITTPEATANCNQVQADRYVGCLTGTHLSFILHFQPPADVGFQDHDQIFSFVVRILRDGTTVLQEIPVVIVVPALFPQYGDAWFVRDFDTSNVCPTGTAPVWGTWAWEADAPEDSKIDFAVGVASSAAGLPSAPVDPLLFSLPPGPMTLAGQAIGVHGGNPSTELGATVVDETLKAKMRARDAKALRLEAHFVPSANNRKAPTLRTWNLSISCQPAE